MKLFAHFPSITEANGRKKDDTRDYWNEWFFMLELQSDGLRAFLGKIFFLLLLFSKSFLLLNLYTSVQMLEISLTCESWMKNSKEKVFPVSQFTLFSCISKKKITLQMNYNHQLLNSVFSSAILRGFDCFFFFLFGNFFIQLFQFLIFFWKSIMATDGYVYSDEYFSMCTNSTLNKCSPICWCRRSVKAF